MVYDEGFEVVIHGRKYFAFSKYLENGTSVCQETESGSFHHLDGTRWGCYRGSKEGPHVATVNPVVDDQPVTQEPHKSDMTVYGLSARELTAMKRELNPLLSSLPDSAFSFLQTSESKTNAETIYQDGFTMTAPAVASTDRPTQRLLLSMKDTYRNNKPQETKEKEKKTKKIYSTQELKERLLHLSNLFHINENDNVEAEEATTGQNRPSPPAVPPAITSTGVFSSVSTDIETVPTKMITVKEYVSSPSSSNIYSAADKSSVGSRMIHVHPMIEASLDSIDKKLEKLSRIQDTGLIHTILTGTVPANAEAIRVDSATDSSNSTWSLVTSSARYIDGFSRNVSHNFDDLPSHFDWRNVNGTDYDSPVREQGTCGSCYAMATLAMIESRIKIKTRNLFQPLLSVQDVVSCSFYSQGCEGGFPYLVGKYGEDFGFTVEDCMRYAGIDGLCPLHTSTCSARRVKVTNYRYIGGYYGNCSEEAMMRELHQNGPIVGSFYSEGELSFYIGGVYHRVMMQELQPAKKDGAWEQTNHSVLIVGWGYDADKRWPYWIIKNTWGGHWGEHGYLRMRRGDNECGIESMAVAMDPVL
eukprot:GILJ01008390.1.p1 GENE.GILJ01008390.1~~GILJ01008390.1.p1  ORF type:complete len:683 (+),score=80.19 GILJ01008390.1:295-2049(+)